MTWFLKQLFQKVRITLLRIFYYLSTLHKRVYRLALHIYKSPQSFRWEKPIQQWDKNQWMEYGNKVWLWFLESLLYILDLVALGEIYGILTDWIKFNTRRLYDWEIELAKTVFADSIHYSLVTIDEKAVFGIKIKPLAKAYVSYHVINAGAIMANGLLIHELVHVWQYERFGSAYTLKAYLAQKSEMQYNYGGVNALRKAIEDQKKFLDFNFEQQGDLVQDYYRIKENYTPLWGHGKREDLHYYEHFVKQLSA